MTVAEYRALPETERPAVGYNHSDGRLWQVMSVAEDKMLVKDFHCGVEIIDITASTELGVLQS